MKDINKKLEILDFGASWCGPCRMLVPIIEEIEREFSDTVEVRRIDVDKDSKLVVQYDVMSVPTLVFLNSVGEVVHRSVGLVPKKNIVQLIGQLT